MRKISAYGPSLIVLITVGVVLAAGPLVVKELTFARTSARIEQASFNLRQDGNILEQINQANRDIAAKVEPSVVYISTARASSSSTFNRNLSRSMRISSGSGWIFDDKGHIVTNEHVIQHAERIQVQLHTGELREAVVIGTDPRTDIAVLRIAAGQLHPAERITADNVKQGDVVFAFGSPFDFRFSMSQGIVSGVKRDAQLQDVRYQNFIQVDAAINPGNSGGPLTNIYGQVVGMNTAIATGRPGSLNDGVFSGIGLAIPTEMIEFVVSQLIDKGEVSRGFIGVELHPDLAFGRARQNGFTGEGIEIRTVNPEGPADMAGVEVGDVITQVDGEKVSALRQIQSIISSHFPGEPISVTIWRLDRETNTTKTIDIEIMLTIMNPETMLSGPMRLYLESFGMLSNLSTATEQSTSELKIPFQRGVLVERIMIGSPIEKSIQKGSIITHVFDESVQNLDELYARLERYVLNGVRRININVVSPDGEVSTITLDNKPG